MKGGITMLYSQDYIRENFGKKLLKAIDSHYSNIPRHKRKGKFKDDYCKQANIERDTFENSFGSWAYKKVLPYVESIVMICNVLNCDMDYFLTEQEELRKDIAHASKTTGLQYDTVNIISNFSPEQKQTLDLITLSNKPTNLGKLLKDFYDYTQSSLQHGTILDDAVEDTEKKERSIHANELLAIRRFDISNKINNMLESLRALYWNKILKQGVEIQKKQDKISMEHFSNVLREHGLNDKDIEKRVSEISASSGYDEIYNNFKI